MVLPAWLAGVLGAEPFWVDVSADSPWDATTPLFREKVTDLAAPIHGKSKYELAGEDVREQRRVRRLRRAAIAALVVLTVLALGAAGVAYIQRQDAIEQRQEADTQREQALQQRNQAEARRLIGDAKASWPAARRAAMAGPSKNSSPLTPSPPTSPRAHCSTPSSKGSPPPRSSRPARG